MKGLAELVVSFCDLCEAEGRLLESGILRTVRRAGLLSLGLLFGAAALALLLAALYSLLTSLLPTPAALGLLGGVSAVIAGLFLWSARGGAARKDGEPKPAAGSGQAGAGHPVRESRAADTASAPKPAGAPTAQAAAVQPGKCHDPWAEVAPYGHGQAPGASLAGKGAFPKGDAGMQEKK